MAAEISPELRQVIDQCGGSPVEVVDPLSRERYVIIRAEDYEKLWHGMDAGTRFLLQEMGRRAGWDDPSMDAYDALDPRTT